jgi:archaellum component FlaD/FlaE
MTGRLNPRRYDLGELRDAARDPSDRSGTDGSAPERPDGGRRDGEVPPVGERDGDDRTVPVEATAPEPPRGSPRPDDTDGERAGAPGERAARPGARTSGSDGARRGDPEQPPGGEPRGRAEADTAEQHQPADDVESYLRSRHRRRDTGDRRSERRSQAAGERAASRRDRRQATPRPEASRGQPRSVAALLAERSGPDVSKPYLDRLPDAYTAQLEVFEWLEGLLTAAGHDGTLSALEYYESIGWLSERSRAELEDVASGLSASAPESAAPSLDIDDHRESLLYIARLAGRRNG